MSPISVTWTLLKSLALWDQYDLNYIFDKRDQLFKFVGKFRYLGIEGLPQEFLIENSSVNVEIKAGAYSLSIREIVYSVQQTGTGALLIVNNYILGLIL